LSRKFMWFYVGLALFFLYLPVLILVVLSFNASRLNVNWTGFTFSWYAELWRDRDIMLAARNSLLVAFVSTAISTVLGTTLALGLYYRRDILNRIVDGLIYVPLVVPETVMGISLLAFYTKMGLGLGLTSVILAHVVFCIPFVTLIVQARLAGLDYHILEAAMDLGATELRALLQVMLPLTVPGIVAGGLLAFTLSLDDFIVTFFTAGPGATTLPIYIYSMVKLGVSPKVNALSTIMLAITAITVITVVFLLRTGSNGRKAHEKAQSSSVTGLPFT